MMTSTSSLTTSSLVHPDAWEDPLLFDELETHDIPAKLLPGILGQFAAALANSTETPEALSVMTVLGVLSTALAKHFVISPKEGWYEAINIYTLIALPPANHKSLVLSTCTKPLVEWEKTQANQLDGSIKRQISERKTQEKIIEGLRIKAAKSKDSLEQKNLIEEIANKEAAPAEIATLPVLFINDATHESLTTIIHEQKGRLGIFSDEGGILETLSGLYSNGIANVDILLKDAKTLYQWLKSLNKLSFTQSEILLAMRNKKLGKADRLLKALSILRERNLISTPIKLSTTRKPTTLYHINPALRSNTARCDSE